MSTASKIEWTQDTWNPVTGCTKVSAGCKHCYAEGVAKRFWKGRPFSDVRCHEDRLDQPLRWRKPRRVFVNSMSDLFHEDVPDEFIAAVFGIMASAPQHTFQILTKRPERMREWFEWIKTHNNNPHPEAGPAIACWSEALGILSTQTKTHAFGCGNQWPLRNVWLGVSVENQATANERIPILLDTPSAVRFLSVEPLLAWLELDVLVIGKEGVIDCLDGTRFSGPSPVKTEVGTSIDWVIVGGESGLGARPMHPQWALDLRDQCVRAGVPFFFKQWGAYRYVIEVADFATEQRMKREGSLDQWAKYKAEVVQSDGTIKEDNLPVDGSACMMRVGKKKAGRLLDGRTWDEFPKEIA